MINVDANKVKKDIADLNEKKQTLLLSLQNDIDAIDRKILEVFRKIGQNVYEMKKSGANTFNSLDDDFAEIDKHIVDKEAKIKKKSEIAERYDDEIIILENLLPKEVPVETAPIERASDKAFCPDCGCAYVMGKDIFCMECGKKL